MALDNEHYFRITFNNSQEFVISHKKDDTRDVLGVLNQSLVNSDYVTLQYKESELLYIKKQQLFSVQKVPKVAIGSTTKIWRVL